MKGQMLMLANSDDLAGRPYRIRTCDILTGADTLISSQAPGLNRQIMQEEVR